MTRRFFLVFSASSILSGCVSFSNIQPSEKLSLGTDEALVVFGVSEGAKIVFHSGDIKDGKFFADGWLPYGIVGTWKLKSLQIKQGWDRILHTFQK